MARQDDETSAGAGAAGSLSITDQWQQLYSPKVLEEAACPRNVGYLLDPDAFASVTGHCGDTMEISIRLDGDTIDQALFLTSGHESAIACCSMLTAMVQGMSLTEASAIRAEDLVVALGGLPKTKEHCAQLAVMTLQEAIRSRQSRI